MDLVRLLLGTPRHIILDPSSGGKLHARRRTSRVPWVARRILVSIVIIFWLLGNHLPSWSAHDRPGPPSNIIAENYSLPIFVSFQNDRQWHRSHRQPRNLLQRHPSQSYPPHFPIPPPCVPKARNYLNHIPYTTSNMVRHALNATRKQWSRSCLSWGSIRAISRGDHRFGILGRKEIVRRWCLITTLLFIKARLLKSASRNVHKIPLPGKVM